MHQAVVSGIHSDQISLCDMMLSVVDISANVILLVGVSFMAYEPNRELTESATRVAGISMIGKSQILIAIRGCHSKENRGSYRD